MAACLDAPHAHPRGAKSRFVPPAHTHWSAEVSNAERVPYLRQHLEHFIGVLTVIEFMVKRDESADANSCDGNASNHAEPLDGAVDNRQPKNCKRMAGRTTF